MMLIMIGRRWLKFVSIGSGKSGSKSCDRRNGNHVPIAWESPAWMILMGIEHERIHLETSSVLIRQLDLSLKSDRCFHSA